MRFDFKTLLFFPVLLLIVLLTADIGILGYFILRDFQGDLVADHLRHAEAYAYRVYAEVAEALHASETGDLTEVATPGGVFHSAARAVLDQNPSILSCAVLDDQGRVVEEEVRQTPARRWQDPQIVEVPLYFQEAQVGTIRLTVSTVLSQGEAREVRDWVFHQHLTALLVAVALSGGSFFLIVRAVSRIRGLDARMEAANRLALMGTVSAGLAHEIRSPLNAIRVNVQMVREEMEALPPDRRPDVGPLIEGVERSIARLNDLLSEFLRVARPPELRRGEVDLNALADAVLQFVAPDCQRRRIAILRTFSEILPILSGDAELLKQMIFNLVLNAIQATPEGGALTVSTGWEESERKKRWLRRLATRNARRQTSEGWAVISVSDTGEGIPANAMGKVFDMFYTTKRGGVGLGLSIVSRIVSDHGGDVDVKSQPGQGTTFIVRLPV